MRALNRKLLRDLWGFKGQVVAIALVLAAGVAGFVGFAATLDSLQLTQARFYADNRFADVFADLRRGPEALAAEVATIPGVAEVETRVVGLARLALPGFPDPISAQLVSLPDVGQARLNQVHLSRGRLPLQADEAVVGEAFAEAHGVALGTELTVILNGREQWLTVVGVGLSPEFIYQIKPGDLFPDFERHTVLWLNRSPLATALDLEGAFNSVVLRLARDARERSVLDRLDLLLEPYGGVGAHGRDLQLSHRFLMEEMDQVEALTTVAPLIFLGVAAFLLNVVVGRLIRNQREQIAILKAFGYGNLAVGLHYLAMVASIVVLGGALGILLGIWLGEGMASLYSDFFRFPYLELVLRPGTMLAALLVTAAAVLAGTLSAVWRAVRLPPAEAMRPEPPPTYRPTVIERIGLKRLLDQPSRMIARHLERQPVKSLLSVLGIAFAVAVIVVGRFGQGSIGFVVDVQFNQAAREDLTVSFVDATSAEALYSLRSLPGVLHVEPFRAVPVELRAGHRSYRTALQGFLPEAELHRVLDDRLRPLRLPAEGVVLTNYLGGLFDVGPGDWIEVEVLEGERQQLQVPVAGLVREYFGANAYMSLDGLNRLLAEGDAVSGGYLAIDDAQRQELQRELVDMPRVAALALRELMIRNFHETMAEVTGIYNVFTTLLAGIIAFGVVYNSARIALAERAWELASLRVLGYSKGEVAYILLGELALLTLAAIVPGFLLGIGFSQLLIQSFTSDLYRIPLVIEPATYGLAAATVIAAAVLSALLVVRQLNRLDLVSALKARE